MERIELDAEPGEAAAALRASPVAGEEPPPPEWRQTVGVVPDLGLSVGDPEMEAGIYVPLVDPGFGYLVLTVTDRPAAVADRLRRTPAKVEPTELVPLVRTLDQAGSENAKALPVFGGLLSALGGTVLGAPLGLLLVQAKRVFVFRVPSGEPWILPLVALGMVVVGALASWLPARRALRVGPGEALRTE